MSPSIFGLEAKKKSDYENGYYLMSDYGRLAKSVAHYELYKSIVQLPRQLIEYGVFKGASLIRFSNYLVA